MSDNSEDSFNFHGIEVSGGQNVLGKNEGGMHQSNGAKEEPTPEQVIDKIEEALPEEEVENLVPEIRGIASLPAAEQEKPEIQEKILSICSQIQPHSATIWKNIAIFGATALDTLAKRNPVIAGIVEVCKANSQPTE